MNLAARTLLKTASAAALAALGLCAVATPAQTPPPAVPAELNNAVGALRAISSMKADFTQTDRNGNRANGVLTMRRPGRIRFQYEPRMQMLIVSDGSALTFIDYKVCQVQRWPIRNSPLGVLLDPSRDVSRVGRLQQTADPNVVSVEVRDSRHPEYGVITLVFVRKASAPGGLELTSWVALDSQNRRTTIRLSNQQYGVGVSDNDFRWNDCRRPARR